MTKIPTPILDLEMFPKDIIEWIKSQIASDEIIHFCVHYKDDDDKIFQTYFLTSHYFIYLKTIYEKQTGRYGFLESNSLVLDSITLFTLRERNFYDTNSIRLYSLQFFHGSYVDRVYELHLDHNAAMNLGKSFHQRLSKTKATT